MTALALTFHAFRLYWSFAFLRHKPAALLFVSPSVPTVAASAASRYRALAKYEDLDALSDQRHEDPLFGFSRNAAIQAMASPREPGPGAGYQIGVDQPAKFKAFLYNPGTTVLMTIPSW